MSKFSVKRYATPPEQRRASYAGQTVFEPGKLHSERDPGMKALSASRYIPTGEPVVDALYRDRGFFVDTADLDTGVKGQGDFPVPVVLETVETIAEEGVLTGTSVLIITEPVFIHKYVKNPGGHGIDAED